MESPIVVRDCAILIDTKRHTIEVVNYAKRKFEVNSGFIQISGAEGKSEATTATRTPFTIPPEEIYLLRSELDDAVSRFSQINGTVKHFKVMVAIVGTVGGGRKAQHATSSAEFVNEGYEIDQYPFHSSAD